MAFNGHCCIASTIVKLAYGHCDCMSNGSSAIDWLMNIHPISWMNKMSSFHYRGGHHSISERLRNVWASLRQFLRKWKVLRCCKNRKIYGDFMNPKYTAKILDMAARRHAYIQYHLIFFMDGNWIWSKPIIIYTSHTSFDLVRIECT